MGETNALAALPQRSLDGWHRFVASGDRDLLAPLLSEHIVFRSPFVQSPIPGRPAAVLVLTRWCRSSRILPITALCCRLPRCRPRIQRQYRQMAAQGRRSHQIQRRRRDDRIRGHGPPDQGPGRAGGGNGEPDRPGNWPIEAAGRRARLILSILAGVFGLPALARKGGLWQGSARLGAAFSADSPDPGTLP
jgi:hypothetical protein